MCEIGTWVKHEKEKWMRQTDGIFDEFMCGLHRELE